MRKSWRNRGLAKHLLVQALIYLKTNELHSTKLEVMTTNQSALSLYQSVGFCVDSEETRYFIQLN
ncbi:GNAT family N-acetyltransferase [Paenibacillus hunanensis]|uniref:GNAT family N-acetyltransferase n=1 Tax=Paenibacillus hunanensis TaxID=539262 RepID=UPI00202663B6|nr:GNAT family N-acetyltransferase [Paenibacillus hunanensis]